MSRSTAIQSAETLAALRAAALPEPRLAARCEDPLAKYFLSPKLRALSDLTPRFVMKHILNFAAPGSYCFTIARTRHFDEILLAELRAGVSQVVVLGAGYDSRAYRFADKLADVSVFEIDHPATQARKRKLLEEAGIQQLPNLSYLPVDFTCESFSDALVREGFTPRRKTVFLWEGVSYYLPRPVVEGVLGYVSGCAPGSSIAFDYAIRRFVDGDTATYGGKQVAQWLEKIGEPFLFGLDAEETEAFLVEQKLQLESDLGPEDVERAYLRTVSGGCLGRSLGHIRMAHGRAVASH